jgi:hypothetical protein
MTESQRRGFPEGGSLVDHFTALGEDSPSQLRIGWVGSTGAALGHRAIAMFVPQKLQADNFPDEEGRGEPRAQGSETRNPPKGPAIIF